MKRRSFLQVAGAAVPVAEMAQAGKFSEVSLAGAFNRTSREFGPRRWARNEPGVTDGLIRTLGGRQALRGVPFELGRAGVDERAWVVVERGSSVEAAVGGAARWLCVASFCDWEAAEFEPGDWEQMESVGAVIAEVVLEYEDGERRALPVRRRYETSPPAAAWGRECFNAVQSNSWRGVALDEPLKKGTDWGSAQQAVLYHALSRTAVWIWALENPRPEARVRAVRFESKAEEPWVICGLTAYHGKQHPLRHERRRLFRFELPSEGDWQVEVDLGIVLRTYVGTEFDGAAWVAGGGLGKREARYLYAEVACASEATVWLKQARGARVEVVEPHKTWVRGRVVDEETGRVVAARLALRSKEGRYIPPYGHRAEINDAWFQDYGADVKLGASSYAYVDGTFQVELPVGAVYVEVSKGFEYEARRERVEIAAGQRELEVRLKRRADWRAKGWVTADTHVHFLSPSTALLEAQAEGLNLVNLLAAQWGDLYTNVGDLAHGHLTARDGETMVSLGTENRQHLMGHLGLLGGHGEAVFPMSGDGPSEAHVGDPMWASMSEWADRCRAREGLVVAVHFPMPNAELAAEIVRGKVDALELVPRPGAPFRTLAYQEWYRYLNCGYRLAAAGGTDKMSAATAVGANRTYAWLGERAFSFEAWAAAVRAGRTFTTTGPLLDLRVEGRRPGDEIEMREGTLEVRVEALSDVPMDVLEVVWNGRVVASTEARGGAHEMRLSEAVRVKGPGWLAARCGTRVSAHTSPVYVTARGEELMSAKAGAYFLRMIEGTQLYVDNLATRPDKERWERVRTGLREAHAMLHARLDHSKRR